MTYFITADTRNGQETKEVETPLLAQAWIWELQDRGAKEIYINDGKKKYTVSEIGALANA
jgi:hypothetical protein